MTNCLSLLSLLLLFSCSSRKDNSGTNDSIKRKEETSTSIPITTVYTNVNSLKQTSVSPYTTASIKKNENTIYSGGASIAWKELKTVLKLKNMSLVNGPDWLSKLNKDLLSKKDIDNKSLQVYAGYGGDVIDSLEKNSGRDLPDSIGEHVVLVSVVISKKLDFPDEIQSSKDGGFSDFSFQGKKVEHNFINASVSKSPWTYKIYDYKGDQQFIVKMPIENDSSELFLAKISPKSNLKETFDYVMSRTSEKYKSNFGGDDKLAFPTIKFDLVKFYDELKRPIIGTDLSISAFEQYLKFSLTNKGVVLVDSVYAPADSVVIDPPVPKILYFNSPFLIIMKEKNSNQPYFLMWVGNTELMVEEKK